MGPIRIWGAWPHSLTLGVLTGLLVVLAPPMAALGDPDPDDEILPGISEAASAAVGGSACGFLDASEPSADHAELDADPESQAREPQNGMACEPDGGGAESPDPLAEGPIQETEVDPSVLDPAVADREEVIESPSQIEPLSTLPVLVVTSLPTSTAQATATAIPLATSAPACDPSYPDFCVPPSPPDLDCKDLAPHENFRVLPPDPHHLDGDGNGLACEASTAVPTAPPTPIVPPTATAPPTVTHTLSTLPLGTASATPSRTPTSTRSPTPTRTPTASFTPRPACDPSYSDFCIPPPPPDLSCASPGVAPHKNFRVLPPDPHHFDGNNNGIGCEG